ncbi:MAG: exodeoxyribonuclease VII large subunit [Ruminococcaceae bacterium]|nr:exodeoxyribonuclease VII large subunit [Oscillospiraceae bacterium]
MLDVKPVVLTVSQLNKYVKSIIDSDENLNYILLEGEISNFTLHRTGHLYFTLKDESSAVKAVMFSRNADKLRFMPENSMKVIAGGRVSVYEATGQYQFYVENMQPDGIGALALEFEQLKQRLEKEGLFDPAHKKPIPKYPEKIGVITSPTGAALHDILNILSRRFKYAEVVFYPSQVQGEYAEEQLAEGLRTINGQTDCDVIIIGRGGGSAEDLWAFNGEKLAREIYNSKIPVISAVGHETDFTIADFVADLRAETPSAAAENAVPDSEEQKEYINKLYSLMTAYVKARLDGEREKISRLVNSPEFKNPLRSIEVKQLKLSSLSDSLYNSVSNRIETEKLKFGAVISKMNALSPLKVLERGYGAVYKNGRAVSSVNDIKTNDLLNLRLSDGEAICEVKEIL